MATVTPDGPGASTVLARSAASSRLAREFVETTLPGPPDDRLAVVVTELVTNAVLHGRSSPRLTLRQKGAEVTVEVTDDGPGWPTMHPGPTFETHGRGLAIVDHFAEEWGVNELDDGEGKVVWARVRLARD
jgi:anti-sigma regulatory factor (Ser/Thr protein kinase)